MVRLIGLFLTVIMLALTAPAQWLDPHLDAQRWGRLRKHQQKKSKKNADQNKEARASGTSKNSKTDTDTNRDSQKPVDSKKATSAERQAAFSRHKAEYRKRLLRDGQASADRWLEETSIAER